MSVFLFLQHPCPTTAALKKFYAPLLLSDSFTCWRWCSIGSSAGVLGSRCMYSSSVVEGTERAMHTTYKLVHLTLQKRKVSLESLLRAVLFSLFTAYSTRPFMLVRPPSNLFISSAFSPGGNTRPRNTKLTITCLFCEHRDNMQYIP
jgi:hypothetical protein